MDPSLLELYAEGSPDDEVAVTIRLADPTDLPAGVRVVAQFGSIVTCRLRRGDIPLVRAGVSSMKPPKLYGHDVGDLPPQEGPGAGDVGEAEEIDLDPEPTDRRRPEGDLPNRPGRRGCAH